MSTTDPNQNLPAQRVEQPPAIASPFDLPTAIADKIRIVEHHGDGGRVIRSVQIDRDLADRAIVIAPVQEVMQADPNYTPSFRLMWCNTDRTYPMPDKPPRDRDGAWQKVGGLSKQIVEDIGKLAGIDVVECDLVPTGDPNIISAKARIRVRRSDGTWLYRSDGGEIMLDVEAEEIAEREAAKNAKAKPDKRLGDAELAAHIRRKQREEKKHYPAKARTKAILRAMRGLLSLQHAYPLEDLRTKPFIVIGYNFTPDRSDPAVQRAMLDAELAVYGRPADAITQPDEHAALPAGSEWQDEPSASVPAPAEVGEAPPGDPAAPADAFQPSLDETTEDAPPDDPPPTDPGAYVVTFAQHAARNGKTIAQLADADLHYVRFLAGLEKNSGGVHFRATKPEHHAAREAALAYLHQSGKADAA